jgi:hypothetical protein
MSTEVIDLNGTRPVSAHASANAGFQRDMLDAAGNH